MVMTGDDMLVWRTRVDLAARYLLREIFEIDEDHVVSDPVMVSEVVTVPTDPHTFVVVLILRQRTWYVVLSSQRGFYTTPARLLKGKDTCQNKLQGPPFYHPSGFRSPSVLPVRTAANGSVCKQALGKKEAEIYDSEDDVKRRITCAEEEGFQWGYGRK
jgi:hypothetical protein